MRSADNFDEWSQGYLDGFDGKDATMSTPSYEQGFIVGRYHRKRRH